MSGPGQDVAASDTAQHPRFPTRLNDEGMNVKILGIALLVVAALSFGAFLYLDRSSGGMLGFSAKRALFGNDGSPKYAEINGIRVYYETHGDDGPGEPVLILHGDLAYMDTMHNQIGALSESHLVIAPDSRAHGRTNDEKETALSYSLMAQDMVALLDLLDIEKVSIFGWSGGGNVGLEMAIRYPQRVHRLVTYGSNFNTDGIEESLLEELTPDNPNLSFFRSFYESVGPDPEHWPDFVGKMKLMWRKHPNLTRDDLAEIKVPTLVMAGELDMVPVAHTKAMAASIPHAELVIVEGQDHFAPLLAPGTVNPRIVEFLE